MIRALGEAAELDLNLEIMDEIKSTMRVMDVPPPPPLEEEEEPEQLEAVSVLKLFCYKGLVSPPLLKKFTLYPEHLFIYLFILG